MGPRRLASRLFWTVAVAAAFAACAPRGSLPSFAPGGFAADRGRRAPAAPVNAVIVMRHNREAELLRLVDAISNPRSPQFRHFLSPAQFAARFGPTPRQRAALTRFLRAAGFTVVRTYPGSTIVDVRAPASAVERTFGTRVDDFDQGAFGTHYANVTRARVPAAIASIVRGVDLDSLVYARPARLAANDAFERPNATPTVEAIKNGGFEKGLRYWKSCDVVALSRLHPFAGKRSALIGSPSTTAGNVRGVQAMCQHVVVPHAAVLRAHTYSITNVTDIRKGGYQEIGFMTEPGRTAAIVLFKGLTDRAHWETHSWALDSLEGQSLYVFFAVAGHGQKNLYDSMFVDNVSLVGSQPTPSPSSSPTPLGPGPGAPLTGPTFGPNGQWAPRAVADAFDFPVQHGYDARTTGVGFVAQSALRTSDLAAFFSANKIERGGSVDEVAVDGGPGAGDPAEAMLDAETVGALAPGANVIAYEIPSFGNTYVIDAYQTAIDQQRANVMLDANPFEPCESDDPGFDDAIESEAIGAAAIGITFVSASGDMGSACYSPRTTRNVEGPIATASIPHVFSVGGNASQTPGPLSTPVVWSGDIGFEVGASGGGVSNVWPLPSYQMGVAGMASATNRNVPDIAFPAVGDDLYLNGSDETSGGTSWSSSIAAALLAETVEICGPLGFVNPAAYGLLSTGEGASLLDVTSGSNAFASFTPYSAAAGYDNASGIGMPNGIKFAAAVCGKTTSLLKRRSR